MDTEAADLSCSPFRMLPFPPRGAARPPRSPCPPRSIELEPLMQMSESPETIERMGAALTAVEDAAIARARH